MAVGFAALRNASELWASAAFTVTVAMLSAAVLGILFARSEDASVFCTGFAITGWIYLLVAFSPWFRPPGNPDPPPLLTTKLMERFYPAVQRSADGSLAAQTQKGVIYVSGYIRFLTPSSSTAPPADRPLDAGAGPGARRWDGGEVVAWEAGEYWASAYSNSAP